MAPLVAAIHIIKKETGEVPTVVGGLAVMCRLSSPYRATTDIDTVQRRAQGDPSHLELLLETPGASKVEAAGAEIQTPSGPARVDVLVVHEAEIAEPNEEPTDRLHVLSHAWAHETATDVVIQVSDPAVEGVVVRETAKLAEPGPLVAMKLQAIESPGSAKEGTDLVDIVRLILDPPTRDVALRQLGICDPRIAAGVALHAAKYFGSGLTRSLARVREVGATDIDRDTLALVGELIMGVVVDRVIAGLIEDPQRFAPNFYKWYGSTLKASPSLTMNSRLLELARVAVSSPDVATQEWLIGVFNDTPDLLENSDTQLVRGFLQAVESRLSDFSSELPAVTRKLSRACGTPMRVGLVGYFGFGNYGDELYIRVHQRLFAGHETRILQGCRAIAPHDPAEIDRQDLVVIGGGDLVDPSRYLARY